MTIEKTKSTGQDEIQTEAQALSSQAVARRHMLLKGLGRGAAVLAATVPIQTLAGQSLLTFDGLHQCSVSGMQSGVHSATPTNTPTCGGYSPGWWGQTVTNSQGQLVPRRQWPTDPNVLCRYIFQASTLLNPDGTPPTLFAVMSPGVGGKFSNTDEFHWICAWLNALSHSFNFPYSGDQVLAFYNAGSVSKTYQDALTFFKTYMENHTPPP